MLKWKPIGDIPTEPGLYLIGWNRKVRDCVVCGGASYIVTGASPSWKASTWGDFWNAPGRDVMIAGPVEVSDG